ncbi:SIR2 family protein [Paractinoplanes globisporus]|uniref:SIR2 family protein n=1 Tax=Paractinoplanes globisporus TaxID=113565 RepID=A0ABW6WD22_9ACTN|nr:SIR2 family protein [Actinoplanes globisporus]
MTDSTEDSVAAEHLEFLAGKLRAGELAFFCGAGISMAPPSRLPSWRELAEGIATALSDDDSAAHLQHLLDAGLRPDVIMQILLEVLGEQALGGLSVLDSKVPNTTHRMIARLARDGGLRHVLTTNFDCLIEIACEEIGVPVRVIVTHADFAAPAGPDDRLTLYKLHGTIERPDTLVADLTGIVRGLDVVKADRVGRLLATYHMLFLGYSGQDFAVNADYLMLEQAHQGAPGFTWNLRHGESDGVLTSLLELYGDRAVVTRGDLPDFLVEWGARAGVAFSEPASPPEGDGPSLVTGLRGWAEGLSDRDRRFGLGRLCLYSGLWDDALEIMRVFYRQAADAMEPRDLALASYYVAHAYERLHAFERTPASQISGDVLIRIDNAESLFKRLGDRRMLGLSYLTRARYLGQDPERARLALRYYQLADEELLAVDDSATRAELLNDIAEQMPFERLDDLVDALRVAGEALDLARVHGDLRQMARSASVTGDVQLQLGRVAEAAAAQADAVRWSRVLADPAALQLALQRRGLSLLRLRDWAAARTAYAEGVELAERLGLFARQATSLTGLGMAEEQLGELDAADRHYGDAALMSLLRRSALPFGNAEHGRARVAELAGRPEAAKFHALNVLYSCEDANWPSYTQAIGVLRSATGRLLQIRYADD